MSAPFVKEKLVRFHHCDPAGIVFYPQYFVLFHELIEDWFNEGLEINYAKFVSDQKLGVPTVHIEADFFAPSAIGDLLTMTLAVRRIGGSSIALSLGAYAGNAARLKIEQTVVLFSLAQRKSLPIPDVMREGLNEYCVADRPNGELADVLNTR